MDNGFNFSITYDKVPVSGDTDFSVLSVNPVGEQDVFTYNVVDNTFDSISGTTTKITTLPGLKTAITKGNGFYISSQRENYYAINGQENKSRDDLRSGIALTPSFKDAGDDDTKMIKAYEAGASKFYFEAVDESKNWYYIYTFADDESTQKYVSHKTGTNSVFLTNDENNTDSALTYKTIWKVIYNNSGFYSFQDKDDSSWYLSETRDPAKGRGFTAY
ncbi:MAG: hypothetical protein IJ906_06100, partial [Oscillospiraceae bacterium]|nr:hypothetical protein [Oscillospiraceae bacterium]